MLRVVETAMNSSSARLRISLKVASSLAVLSDV